MSLGVMAVVSSIKVGIPVPMKLLRVPDSNAQGEREARVKFWRYLDDGKTTQTNNSATMAI